MAKLFSLLFSVTGLLGFLGILFTDNIHTVFVAILSGLMVLLLECLPDEDDEEVTYKNIKR